MLNIVLFEPEIPPNTGNIIRLCANTGFNLHLIKPLGFELDDKRLRRAGLDYREFKTLTTHDNWQAYSDQLPTTNGGQRVFAISTKGHSYYTEPDFRPGDSLVLGPETRGLPATFLNKLPPENILRIPMQPESRSLNLSNAAAIVTYEAWRQLNFTGAI